MRVFPLTEVSLRTRRFDPTPFVVSVPRCAARGRASPRGDSSVLLEDPPHQRLAFALPALARIDPSGPSRARFAAASPAPVTRCLQRRLFELGHPSRCPLRPLPCSVVRAIPGRVRRSLGDDLGLFRPTFATHDSFFKTGTPHCLGRLRATCLTWPGSPRFHADGSLRRAGRARGAFLLRAVAPCVPLTSRRCCRRRSRERRWRGLSDRAPDSRSSRSYQPSVRQLGPLVTEVTAGSNPSAEAASTAPHERSSLR